MRVRILSRNPSDYARETKSDIHRIQRNVDPALHPLEGAREYQRALNAAKLERVFAKPFLGSLSGHTDGVYCMAKHPCRLSCLVSGSCDGEIRVWNLSRQECMCAFTAHRSLLPYSSGFVRGVTLNTTGTTIISVGNDQCIKYWPLETSLLPSSECQPISTILGKTVFTGIDHHWSKAVFATCSNQVDIWDETRSEPLRSLTWGADGVSSVRFNPVERNILCSTGSDRSIALYDIRGAAPLKKAFNFTAANEDSNLYTFDMRRLDQALCVHMDHVGAVLDCDYAPTGREFVSGGYDRTIRIFPYDKGHSREVYYTKRMQRVFCVKWSGDCKFVLSGSDETNIRLWKAQASEKLGSLAPRQRAAFDYNSKLKEKYKEHPQVRRIIRHRNVPKLVYKQGKEKKIMLLSRKRKEENVRKHSKPDQLPQRKPERQKPIVSVVA